jgi:hypothetical protein
MKTRKPTEAQAAWLKRIAHSPLLKTCLLEGAQGRYSLEDGTPVPLDIAERLIRNGWVRARRVSGAEQTYAPHDRVYEALRP